MGTVFILFVYAIVYIGKILIEHLFSKTHRANSAYPAGARRISGGQNAVSRPNAASTTKSSRLLSKWSNAMAPDCNTVF